MNAPRRRQARRRAAVVSASSLVVAGLLLAAGPAYAGDGGYTDGHAEDDTVTVTEGWTNDGEGPDGGQDTDTTPVSTGPVGEPQPWQQHRYVPSCDVNRPEGGADALCGHAVNACPREDGNIRLLMMHWVRWVYPDGTKGTWEFVGNECRGPDDPEPARPEATPEAVTTEAKQVAPPSQVHVEPEARTYVNVPTNFYADDESVTVNVYPPGGWTVAVHFAPSEFSWNFGDGHTGSGAGVQNAEVGQAGAVEHGYERGGDYAVTLTRTYTISFTLPDGTAHTIPGVVSSTSEPYPLAVGEVQTTVQDVG